MGSSQHVKMRRGVRDNLDTVPMFEQRFKAMRCNEATSSRQEDLHIDVQGL